MSQHGDPSEPEALDQQLIENKPASTGSSSSGFLRSLVNILAHVVYPVVMAPFFVGVFYMVAAWRLAAPNMSGSCLTRLLVNPSRRGGPILFAFTGGLFRACPSGSKNTDSALVLFITGMSLLFSGVAPVFDIVVSDKSIVPGDSALVAATIVSYILTVYVCLWVGLKFTIYSRAEKAAERAMASYARHIQGSNAGAIAPSTVTPLNATPLNHGPNSVVNIHSTRNAAAAASRANLAANQQGAMRSILQKRREALQYIEGFPEIELKITPLWAVFIGLVATVIECALFKIFSGHFEGAAARFRNLSNEWSALTYATMFFLLMTTNTLSWFGFYLLYEQQHRLSVFEEKAMLNANELPVAKWSVAWQHLLQEMERSPMVCSIAPACSLVLFFEAIASMMFAVLYNLFSNQAFKDLLPIALFVGAHSALLLTAYLVVIVRTQNVIERQHKTISALQNQVQLQVDEASRNDQTDEQQLEVLRAKVRVLQSLDRFLVIADPKPRILGSSVDAFRWGIINFSLITINITFLLLYLVFCFQPTKNRSEQNG